jgi:hypothetical protein
MRPAGMVHEKFMKFYLTGAEMIANYTGVAAKLRRRMVTGRPVIFDMAAKGGRLWDLGFG